MDRFPFDPYDFFGYLASGLLIVVGMDLVLGFPNVLGRELKAFDTAVLIIAIYIAGQLVATPAKALLEDGIVDKILGRPNVNLFRAKKPRIRGLLFPGFYKPLPSAIRVRVHANATQEGASASGESLFLHVRFHPQIRKDEQLMARLTGFLNKYGFARNLGFTCLVVGIALLAKQRIGPVPGTADIARYGWTALVVGILLFYRYLKFFRQYSYEMFNTYAALKTDASAA